MPREDTTTAPWGWMAAGAALAGVLLGGAAMYLGLRYPSVPAKTPMVGAGVTGGGSVPAPLDPAPAEAVPAPAVDTREHPPSSPGDLVSAVAATRDCVVNLTARARNAEVIGAGVIVDPDGVLLTNYHVIADALRAAAQRSRSGRDGGGSVIARFEDGRELPSTVLIADAAEDLAVLKLRPADTAERFHACSLGNSAELKVGQEVFAIGNPFGLPHTVSAGIVSALNRTDVLDNRRLPVIQLDASINVGNSGGPLFDLAGQLVGVTTARAPRAQGIAFAIPIDHIQAFLRVASGRAARTGRIGVQLGNRVDARKLETAGYQTGVLLSEVDGDGAAARAGLQSGDVIVEVRGRRFDGVARPRTDFAQTVRALFPGEVLQLAAVRGEEVVRVDVEVEAEAPEKIHRRASALALELLGLVLDPDSEVPVIASTKNRGARSKAAASLAGSRIVALMGIKIETMADLRDRLESLYKLTEGAPVSTFIRLRRPDGRDEQRMVTVRRR